MNLKSKMWYVKHFLFLTILVLGASIGTQQLYAQAQAQDNCTHPGGHNGLPCPDNDPPDCQSAGSTCQVGSRYTYSVGGSIGIAGDTDGPLVVCVGSENTYTSDPDPGDFDSRQLQRQIGVVGTDPSCPCLGPYLWENIGEPEGVLGGALLNTWLVHDTDVTTGGSITAEGVLTAPNVPGTYEVVAVYEDIVPPGQTGVTAPNVGTVRDEELSSEPYEILVIGVESLEPSGGFLVATDPNPLAGDDPVDTRVYFVMMADSTLKRNTPR